MAIWGGAINLQGLKFKKMPAPASTPDDAQPQQHPQQQTAPAASFAGPSTRPGGDTTLDRPRSASTGHPAASERPPAGARDSTGSFVLANDVPAAALKPSDPRNHPKVHRRVVNILAAASMQQPRSVSSSPISNSVAQADPTHIDDEQQRDNEARDSTFKGTSTQNRPTGALGSGQQTEPPVNATASTATANSSVASASANDLPFAPTTTPVTAASARSETVTAVASTSAQTLFRQLSDSEGEDNVGFSTPALSHALESPPLASVKTEQELSTPLGRTPSQLAPSNRGSRKRPRTSLPSPAGMIRLPPLPHYTVIRAAENSSANPHVIRIHKGVTDGSPSRWPTNTTPGEHVDGRLNWHDPIPLDRGTNDQWRRKVAKELAMRLGLNSDKDAGGKSEHWILEDWPEHWKFFLHRTGRASTGAERTDPYLFVNETIPHIEWLLLHGPDDDRTCECKYCGKRTQAEVNERIGLPGLTQTKRESSVAGSLRTPSKRIKAEPQLNRSAHKARHGPPLRSQSPVARSERAASNRSLLSIQAEVPHTRDPKIDLPSYRGSYTNKQRDFDLSGDALFRQGEVVWARLPRPLRDSNIPHELSMWPGVVAERTISVTSKWRGQLKPGVPPRIDNVQQYTYTIKLLGVDDTVTLLQGDVVPWLGSTPLTSFVLDPRWTTAPNAVNKIWDGKRTLMPVLTDFEGLSDAATTYALALQIAKSLVQSFGLNDRYTITESHIRQRAFGPLTLQDDIERAHQLRHFHYQSLWWGAELVWSGELVRLLLNDISDLGVVKDQLSRGNHGSQHFSYFLKVSAIYKDSTTDVAKMVGTLYELCRVDERTEDEEDEQSTSDETADELYLPRAPPGYKFVQSLAIGLQAQVDIDLLAGRYYPPNQDENVNEFETKVDTVRNKSKGANVGEIRLSNEERLICLSGVLPASFVYMPCQTFSQGRREMVIQAELNARASLGFLFLGGCARLLGQNADTPMDVST
ncbi:hypothetical protein OIV83_005045 [Microbotryomycetes sp. JL201]|nr:hypothetical protein OIV83_005045 [Microbotryomycetes sp. JL201]